MDIVLRSNNGTRKVKVFVIMPFGNRGEYHRGPKESDHVFNEIVRPAVERAGEELGLEPTNMEIVREVDKNQAGSITESILTSLVAADVVIADLTGCNANVFFELGVRFCLRRKVTLLMVQEGTVLPFDIQDFRVVKYDPFMTGEARCLLANFITTGFSEKYGHDSIVFRTFPALSVRISHMLDECGDEAARAAMPWDEFMDRIEWVGGQLSNALLNGTFAPDALVGISNGGLIVADILGRNYLRGTPVLSLWAQRFTRGTDHPSWYFKNSYNDSLMQALASEVRRKRLGDPAKILLVDDRVGTGKTAQQAIDYLREALGDDAQIVFVPLVISRPEYVETIKTYLPCNFRDMQSGRKIFAISETEFLGRLVTDAMCFPYKKVIEESVQ